MTQLKVVAKETGQELAKAKLDSESNPMDKEGGMRVLGFVVLAGVGIATFLVADKLSSDAVAAQVKTDTTAGKTPQQIAKGSADLLTGWGAGEIIGGLVVGGLSAYFLEEGIALAALEGVGGGLIIAGANSLWMADKITKAAANGITVAVVA